MTNSQTDHSYTNESPYVGDKIYQLRADYEIKTNKRPTHIVIGKLTYLKLSDEFYRINGLRLPPPNSHQACELMGMLFSFINYDNYLAVR